MSLGGERHGRLRSGLTEHADGVVVVASQTGSNAAKFIYCGNRLSSARPIHDLNSNVLKNRKQSRLFHCKRVALGHID